MSEQETEARTETEETPNAFVQLSENPHASVEAADDESLEGAEEAEPQETATETAEDEKPEPPSAKELGFDESSPEGKAAYKAMLSRWNKWVSRREQKEAAKEKEPEQTRAAEAPAPEQAQTEQPADPIDAVYDVKFDDFKPELSFPEGSDLNDYKSELTAAMREMVLQGVQHTLKSVRANDMVLRQQLQQQERIGTARGVLENYQQAVADHPDLPTRLPEIQAFLTKGWVREMAREDPEGLVDTLETKFGLDRNWREGVEQQTRAAGAEARETATRLRTAMPRPTAAVRTGGDATGKMREDEAFEAAWRSSRRA